MNVYRVTVESGVTDDGTGYFLREGPIYVSARSYTEVEAKFAASVRYGSRKVAEIELLGSLDKLEF